jgi:hypothetical protein
LGGSWIAGLQTDILAPQSRKVCKRDLREWREVSRLGMASLPVVGLIAAIALGVAGATTGQALQANAQ